MGCSREGVYKVWWGNDCDLFWIRCWNSSMASILFCISDFSSIGGSGKGVCEAEYEKEDGGQGGWKFDSEEVNPHWLYEE